MSETASRKIYYSMGEVCEMFDVKPSLVRFWEKKFDVIKPDKNKKGNRLFTPQDIENLKLIYHLIREKGMTLQGAQNVMRSGAESVKSNGDLVERLGNIRAQLAELYQLLEQDEPDKEQIIIETTPQNEKLAFIQQSLF